MDAVVEIASTSWRRFVDRITDTVLSIDMQWQSPARSLRRRDAHGRRGAHATPWARLSVALVIAPLVGIVSPAVLALVELRELVVSFVAIALVVLLVVVVPLAAVPLVVSCSSSLCFLRRTSPRGRAAALSNSGNKSINCYWLLHDTNPRG